MVNGGKINRGSCVYVNGISLSVITSLLVIVRRNGFRTSELSAGQSVKHCGTTVIMDNLGLIIKGGKTVNVMNDPERCKDYRYTVNPKDGTIQVIGTNTMIGAMRTILSNWTERTINSKLIFMRNKTGEFIVCSNRSGDPIGLN